MPALHQVLAERKNIGLHRMLQIALQALEPGGKVIIFGFFAADEQQNEQGNDEGSRPQQNIPQSLLIHGWFLS